MPSATEECRKPSGNCRGISHCLESGHPISCINSCCLIVLLQRIAGITMTLQYGLEASFREGLSSGNADVLRECLRTYSTIDKTRDAEALFRSCVVKPYMDEVFACYALFI